MIITNKHIRDVHICHLQGLTNMPCVHVLKLNMIMVIMVLISMLSANVLFFAVFPKTYWQRFFSHPECTSSCKRKYLKCTQEENHFPKEEKFSPKQNPNFTWNSFGQIWAKFNIIFNFKYFMKCHVHIKAGLGSLQLNLSTIFPIFPTISQGDDEPTRHNDGRDSQLPPSIPAVHTVQLHGFH